MALTVVATAGAANANSYATVADANSYHEGHLYASTWFDTEKPTQEQALVMATRILDQCFTWSGVVAAQAQALRWPRIDTYDRDGRALSALAIPTDIVRATCELARWLVMSDRTALQHGETVAQVKIGEMFVAFGAGGSSTTGGTVPQAVRQIIGTLGVYAERAASAGSVSIGRG